MIIRRDSRSVHRGIGEIAPLYGAANGFAKGVLIARDLSGRGQMIKAAPGSKGDIALSAKPACAILLGAKLIPQRTTTGGAARSDALVQKVENQHPSWGGGCNKR